MSPILPILEPERFPQRATISLEAWMWSRIDEIAKAEGGEQSALNRNDVIAHFLRWAFEQYEREKTEAKKKR